MAMSQPIEQRATDRFPPGPSPAGNLAALVLASLPRERARAVTIARLARRLGCARRDIEQALQDLADAGAAPICASSSAPMGVWLGSRTEVRAYLERHDGRIRSMLRRRHGLRRWLTTPEPRPVQVELWEVAS